MGVQVPLARWVSVTAVAVVLAAQSLAGAAEQRGLSEGPSGPPTGQIRQAAPPAQQTVGRNEQERPPAPRFQSILKFDRRPDVGRLASPFGGRTPRSLGFYPLWLYEEGPVLPADGQTVRPPTPSGFPVGGLQLDVQPWRAQVWIDGAYAGVVGDYTGYYKPLELPAGDHVVEILAENHVPLVFYITISPGVTSTYRGTLDRAPGH